MKRSWLVPRTRVRLTSLVGLVFAALLASGCMTTHVTMLTPVEYAAVEPDSVQVFLRAEDAPRTRVQLAVVSANTNSSISTSKEGADRERVIRALRERAGKLGADAIILRDISPRPGKPTYLRGWALAIRAGVTVEELAQDSTLPEPAAVVPPWTPPPVVAPPPVTLPVEAPAPPGSTQHESACYGEQRACRRVAWALGIGAAMGFGFGAATGAITEPGITGRGVTVDAILVGLLGAVGGFLVGVPVGVTTVIVNPRTPTQTVFLGSGKTRLMSGRPIACVFMRKLRGATRDRLGSPETLTSG